MMLEVFLVKRQNCQCLVLFVSCQTLIFVKDHMTLLSVSCYLLCQLICQKRSIKKLKRIVDIWCLT